MEPTISSLIGAAERGSAGASEALFAALYSELKRLATRQLARHGSGVSLSATTLLHQAYLDIAEREGPSFADRAHFMGYAARVMRGLIIDHARSRQAQKRGGQFEITSLARHRALTIGTLIFAAQALWVNIARSLEISWPDIYNTLGFAIFLLSIGYTGVEIMVTDERRLLSLDDELAIARQLQFAILPERTPQIVGLEIAAVYKPMSAVAGDLYDFLVVDEQHVGLSSSRR